MMFREPVQVPAQSGVYALVNRKRRFAYVAYTGNLQKRSHSMSHMLLQQDQSKKSYWPIRNMPKHPSDEFTFLTIIFPVTPANADEMIAKACEGFRERNYTIIEGNRMSVPMVTFKGKQMSVVEAIEASRSKVKYLTVWRRIERGWTPEQALGLVPPAPRWDHIKQDERRRRARA